MNTNKNLIYGLLAGVTVVLTGCWQKSLEPFYTDKDLTTDSRLIGSWSEPDKKPEDKPAVWTFTEAGEKRYRLTIVDPDDKADFDARLFKLGNAQFLDLFSRKRGLSEIPAHHLINVSFEGDKLEMKLLSMEWIKNWTSSHPKSLAHIRMNDPEEPENTDKMEVVLTAKTAELQAFIREHLNDKGFFDSADALIRTQKK